MPWYLTHLVKGQTAKFLERLNELKPGRILYVACDPAALGRDTAILRELGWDLVQYGHLICTLIRIMLRRSLFFTVRLRVFVQRVCQNVISKFS